MFLKFYLRNKTEAKYFLPSLSPLSEYSVFPQKRNKRGKEKAKVSVECGKLFLAKASHMHCPSKPPFLSINSELPELSKLNATKVFQKGHKGTFLGEKMPSGNLEVAELVEVRRTLMVPGLLTMVQPLPTHGKVC